MGFLLAFPWNGMSSHSTPSQHLGPGMPQHMTIGMLIRVGCLLMKEMYFFSCVGMLLPNEIMKELYFSSQKNMHKLGCFLFPIFPNLDIFSHFLYPFFLVLSWILLKKEIYSHTKELVHVSRGTSYL